MGVVSDCCTVKVIARRRTEMERHFKPVLPCSQGEVAKVVPPKVIKEVNKAVEAITCILKEGVRKGLEYQNYM